MVRILMLCPAAGNSPTGNSTTARRLIVGLEKSGHPCTLVGPDYSGPVEADLIVALHAVHCGPAAAQLAAANGIPYLILFVGTDLNGKPPGRARLAVNGAATCIALAPHAQKRAREVYAPDSVEIIPQAARPLPEGRSPAVMPAEFPDFAADDFVVLQPCSIRSVKAPQVGVKALASLAQDYPRLRLCIVGPEIEPAEGQALRDLLAQNPWASWPGPLHAKQMATILRRADFVLSTSRSEGAAPNALLEAALFGRPICASDIPAHRYFPGQDHIYKTEVDLRQAIELCMLQPQNSALSGRRMQELTRTRFDPTRETVAWDRLVRRMASKGRV